MSNQSISEGTVHKLPPDLKKALTADKAALAKWEDITPLARNEWICWVESVKTEEIRQRHVERTVADLKGGKRRSGLAARRGRAPAAFVALACPRDMLVNRRNLRRLTTPHPCCWMGCVHRKDKPLSASQKFLLGRRSKK